MTNIVQFPIQPRLRAFYAKRLAEAVMLVKKYGIPKNKHENAMRSAFEAIKYTCCDNLNKLK